MSEVVINIRIPVGVFNENTVRVVSDHLRSEIQEGLGALEELCGNDLDDIEFDCNIEE